MIVAWIQWILNALIFTLSFVFVIKLHTSSDSSNQIRQSEIIYSKQYLILLWALFEQYSIRRFKTTILYQSAKKYKQISTLSYSKHNRLASNKVFFQQWLLPLNTKLRTNSCCVDRNWNRLDWQNFFGFYYFQVAQNTILFIFGSVG